MNITLEELDTAWDARDKEPPFELVDIILQSKAFLNLRKPESPYEAMLMMIVAFATALYLGYSIAASEKLEELIHE